MIGDLVLALLGVLLENHRNRINLCTLYNGLPCHRNFPKPKIDIVIPLFPVIIRSNKVISVFIRSRSTNSCKL